MPLLAWNEVDFLEYFAVQPDADDYSESITYDVQRGELRLVVTMWQFESVIQASVFRISSEAPLWTFAAYVRGEVRVINDVRGHYIDFEDSIIAPTRFWYIQAGNPFDRIRFPISVTIRLSIKPDIQIVFADYFSRT